MNGRSYESPYYNGGGGGGGFGGGGGGAGGGGGFVQGGSPFGGSQGSPGGKGGKIHTIRPVTLKQVENAHHPHPDADFSIDGSEVALLSVVAVARNCSRTPTQEVYQLEDGTGGFEARRWFSKDSGVDDMEQDIQQDVYVRVIGEIKEFNNKRHLMIKAITPIKDHNEVTYHLLHALAVSLESKRPSIKKYEGHAGGISDYSMSGMNQNGLLGQSAGGAGAANPDNQWSEFPPIHRSILKHVQDNGDATHEGCSVSSIARSVGGDPSAIIDAIEYLLQEGQLYTTVDDEHVKIV